MHYCITLTNLRFIEFILFLPSQHEILWPNYQWKNIFVCRDNPLPGLAQLVERWTVEGQRCGATAAIHRSLVQIRQPGSVNRSDFTFKTNYGQTVFVSSQTRPLDLTTIKLIYCSGWNQLVICQTCV